MSRAPFKVLALSMAIVILALTPATSLFFWVENGSEIIHSSSTYTVTYKPSILNALTRPNDTTLKIEVRDERGRPLTFTALLSGPTSDSVIEVGNVSGKGYAVKSIGKYVAEVRKVLMKANSDPERSGIGMLILLSTIIEENGEYYAAADAITIPIIPGKAVGKEIVATVKFKPIMKFKVKSEGGSERGPQEPSRTIIKECYRIGDPGYEETICYIWKLSKVLYASSSWDYIPVAITKLDNDLGGKTKYIIHSFTIAYSGSEYVSFDLSMGWKISNKLTLYAPGPGYRYYFSSKNEIIYKITCEIDSTSSSDQSWCQYLISNDYSPNLYAGKFTGDVLFSTGFFGKLWLVEYKYVLVSFSDGSSSEKVLQDNVLAVWMEPTFNSFKKINAAWEVDDNPNDYGDEEVTEYVLRILESNVTYRSLDVGEGAYSLLTLTIFFESKASWQFGVGIPIGALAIALVGTTGPAMALLASIVAALSVGIEAGDYTDKLYSSMGNLMVRLLDSYSYYGVRGRYAEFKNTYTVKEESADRVVPLFIFSPFIRS